MTVFLMAVWGGSALGQSPSVSDLLPALSSSSSAITVPRYASGDLDADGTQEVVIAGRVGPFRAITDPFESKQARMDVYRWSQGDLQRIWSSPNLHVINDVAAGDLDGNGAAEIVAIGDQRMHVWSWADDHAELAWSSVLSQGRALRLDTADLDSDGKAELVVAQQVPGFCEDVVPTDINVYAFDGQSLGLLSALRSDGHVGDLALARSSSGDVYLFFEEGQEEVGGTIAVYRLVGTSPVPVARQVLDPARARVLSLSAETTPSREVMLALANVSGQVSIYAFDGLCFSLAESAWQMGPSSFRSGLLLGDLSHDGLLQLIYGGEDGAPLMKAVGH